MSGIEIQLIVTKDFGTNCYIIIEKSSLKAIIIDPGFNEKQGKELIELIKHRNLDISHIINTHGHSDHISGNMLLKQYTDAVIISHEADNHFFDTPWHYFNEIGKFGTPCFKCGNTTSPVIRVEDTKALISCAGCGPLLYVHSQELPDKYVVNEDIINLGDIKIQVIYTPGHTAGCISLYIEKHNILFTGDTLFAGSVGRTDLPFASNEMLNQSLKKIMSLPDITVVYPGHGEKTTLAIERENNTHLSLIL